MYILKVTIFVSCHNVYMDWTYPQLVCMFRKLNVFNIAF